MTIHTRSKFGVASRGYGELLTAHENETLIKERAVDIWKWYNDNYANEMCASAIRCGEIVAAVAINDGRSIQKIHLD